MAPENSRMDVLTNNYDKTPSAVRAPGGLGAYCKGDGLDSVLYLNGPKAKTHFSGSYEE